MEVRAEPLGSCVGKVSWAGTEGTSYGTHCEDVSSPDGDARVGTYGSDDTSGFFKVKEPNSRECNGEDLLLGGIPVLVLSVASLLRKCLNVEEWSSPEANLPRLVEGLYTLWGALGGLCAASDSASASCHSSGLISS